MDRAGFVACQAAPATRPDAVMDGRASACSASAPAAPLRQISASKRRSSVPVARAWSSCRSIVFGAALRRPGCRPNPPRPVSLGVVASASAVPSSELKAEIERVAMTAAREAGAIIRAKCGKPSSAVVKGVAVDLVTEVDKASEEIIRGHIARAFPAHAILGEEGVEPGPAASVAALAEVQDAEWLWIIDPLDGTLNFVHGLPLSVVSIAVAHRGELQVAVIYDPFMDEMYTARRGEGALLNGRPMRVSGAEEATLTNAMLATGFPATVRPEICRGMAELLPLCRSLRASGSACLHLAWVASGRLTGFWECDLHAWDIAAGALLVAEAGGRMTDTRGRPYTIAARNVIASNGRVHDDIAAALARCDGTGFP